MPANADHIKQVVVVGAGEAGVSAALRLKSFSKRHKNVHVTLIDERGAYSIPYICREYLTGRRQSPTGIGLPIDSFIEGSSVDMLEESVTRIDTAQRFVETNKGRHSYDFLLLAPDALPDFERTPGSKQHAFILNGLPDIEALRTHVTGCFEKASKETDSKLRKALLTFVVIGGDPEGVELAIALSEWFSELRLKYWVPVEEIEVLLVERDIDVVPGHLKRVRDAVERSLRTHNIRFLCGKSVSKICESSVKLDGGVDIPTKTAVLMERIKVASFMQALDSSVREYGRVPIEADMRSRYAGVYLAGDVASPFDPRREGPIPAGHKDLRREGIVAAKNICSDIAGGTYRNCLGRLETHSIYLGEHNQLVFLGTSILPQPLAKVAERFVRALSIYRLGGLSLIARFPGLLNPNSPEKVAGSAAA